MIRANFSAYGSYVTDSLYQWDINRDLAISGLNLSVAPEIQFINASMRVPIVKQMTLTNGVVKVRIPNSLLQTNLTIKAYIGIYEGETFKVIETVEIPIIAKEKPSDYMIEDSDEEIYSFNRLENKINNLILGNVPASSARIDEVRLTASGWIGESSPYRQVVNIDGVTANSQVDLTPSVDQLAIFYEKDLAFVTENVDGKVTVYAIGQKPQNTYTIQVTITEVVYDG